MKKDSYEIESVRMGTALELAVEGLPVGCRRGQGGCGLGARGPGRGRAGVGASGAPDTAARGGAPGGPGGPSAGRGTFAGVGGVIPPQDVTEVSKKWHLTTSTPAWQIIYARRDRNGPPSWFLDADDRPPKEYTVSLGGVHK